MKEASVKVDVGYASRVYRRPSQLSSDWKVLIVFPRAPEGKRGGLIIPIEGDAWLVTLAGWLKDYPPDDEISFLEYTRSLPMPDLYEAIIDAEPVTPIVTHKFPANRRRYYERMSRFPEGFLVVGDALCSFNPVYGQGMTVAALEASALQACLQQQRSPDTRRKVAGLAHRFQKAVAKVANVPWLLATGEDLRYPETEGNRPPGTSLINWYMGRVHELVASDHRATLRFHEVANMLKPPLALFEPHILFAVLFKGRRLRPGRDAAVGQVEEERQKHGESWLSTLRHIAIEDHVFVLGCNMVLRTEDISDSYPCKQFYSGDAQGWIYPGGSVIIDPSGELIAGPMREQEVVLYAEIDSRQVYGAKWMLDVAGHDARADIFQLTVCREPRRVIQEAYHFQTASSLPVGDTTVIRPFVNVAPSESALDT